MRSMGRLWEPTDHNREMPYDPDGDPDIDFDDLEAVVAWLNNPTVQALHEDLGRQIRSLPPEEQIEDLATQLRKAQGRRDELAALLDGESPDDPRAVLLDAMNDVIKLRRRITEVRDQKSDG